MKGSAPAIVIRGRRYLSAQTAARRFGVTTATVLRAAREGTLDRVGLPGGRKFRPGPFVVRGEVFPDPAAIAARFGVDLVTVQRAIRAGRLDVVGLGPGCRTRMRVRIRNMVFADLTTAARHFGVSERSLRMRILRGTLDGAGLPARNPRNGSKPFTIAGLSWPSQAEACRDLGLGQGFIAHFKRHRLASTRERILAAAMAYRARMAGGPPEQQDRGRDNQDGRGQTRAGRAEGAEAWKDTRAA